MTWEPYNPPQPYTERVRDDRRTDSASVNWDRDGYYFDDSNDERCCGESDSEGATQDDAN